MFGILLGSHGHFAEEALKSAEMIIGEQKNVASFSLEENMDLEMTITKAQEAYASLDATDGVIILTDIVGGTPSNVANVIQKKNENTYVLSGFNLPILLQIFLNREQVADQVVKQVKEMFPTTLADLSMN
ncbi:PTS sugar transporter subunit IIA [Lederbergia sp. NSJ-179]|uniref:PTS sugar transporter subunit IIA n=1 Tax=Lederbergia sp. NSJ-179 TaxID=2931402 RepID=UPI001FD28937|nr:PTS sugar transporter subunit IIA [Lederbergia sp. NSJ-179]MCJ7841608.1 PTS sugar transporter subunit IIA [Lederbergia sp. NSJ-179]